MAKFKLLLASAIMFAITGFFVMWLGPDLKSDFQNRSAHFEPARDVRITQARCRSKLFVISFCEISLSGKNVPGGKQEISYLIFGGLGDEPIGLMRTATPGAGGQHAFSTRIGMDYLTNRIISFAVFVVLLGALCVGGLIALFRGKTA